MEAGLAHPKQKPPFSATTTANPLEQLASTASIDNLAIPGYQSCWDEFSIDGSSSIQSRDTLQSIVNGSSHCQYSPQGSLLSLDQNKLLQDIESSCFSTQQKQIIGISSGLFLEQIQVILQLQEQHTLGKQELDGHQIFMRSSSTVSIALVVLRVSPN
ncbi:hypothetical protein SLA2020_236930 [Shorea laevis]